MAQGERQHLLPGEPQGVRYRAGSDVARIEDEQVVNQPQEEDAQPNNQQLQQQIEQLRERIEQLQARQCTGPRVCFCTTLLVSLLAVVLATTGLSLTVYYSGESRYAVYEIIGSSECPTNVSGSTQMYSGITIGFNNEGRTDFHCMPTGNDTNEHVRYYFNEQHSNITALHGHVAKYVTFADRNGFIAQCAKCMIIGRETVDIVRATYSCHETWTEEYNGYLMTTGICVDKARDGFNHSTREYIKLEHQEISSAKHLGLNYTKSDVLTCAVCSK